MLPGETIATGAQDTCPDCETKPRLDIYMSGAGYYIGTWCDCGPYSRESDYFRTRQDAEKALAQGAFERK